MNALRIAGLALASTLLACSALGMGVLSVAIVMGTLS